jgi:hypothetical protein
MVTCFEEARAKSAQESEQDHGFRATTPIAFVWHDWITRKGARPF